MLDSPRVRFSYYQRLSASDRRVYRRSDAAPDVALPDPAELRPLAAALEQALATGKRSVVQSAASKLGSGITRQLGVAPVRVQVLSRRPANAEGELHGLYTSADDGEPARIQVWMRTAEQRRVVAFRTFLRTFLHEIGHHLDLVHLGLADTFHTEGFFRRESSLLRQLAVPAKRAAGRAAPAPKPPRQLGLFDSTWTQASR
jgi:hypothetical protein